MVVVPAMGLASASLGSNARGATGRLLSLLTMPIVLEMHLLHARSMAVCLGILLLSIAAFCNAQP